MRETWALQFPNGDGKFYDTLWECAEDIANGAFLEPPSGYHHILEDGRTDPCAEDNIREAVEDLNRERAPYPRMSQMEFI